MNNEQKIEAEAEKYAVENGWHSKEAENSVGKAWCKRDYKAGRSKGLEREKELEEGLRKIEQMSDPGSPERGITYMKGIASKLLKKCMTQKNKSNRLIAEYDKYTNNYWYHNNELRYHESFDEIVPIIKKIYRWVKSQEGVLPKTVEFEQIQHGLLELNIKKIWKGVVKWISWYNQISTNK